MKKGRIRITPKHRDEINLDQIVTALFLHTVHGDLSAENPMPESKPSSRTLANTGGGDGEVE